jgi:phytol kinase
MIMVDGSIQNIIALVLTFMASLLWLRANDFVAHKGWVSSQVSRKIIHMGTGPIYVVCWLLFANAYYVRFFVALVPLLITIQFFLVGIGVINDDAAVKAMSRTGDRREILRGPLYYGLIFVFLTIIFWLDTPIGIVALMLMCGGDGLADILGRRFGYRKLPWNTMKSWAGSVGMLIGGWLFAVIIVGTYVSSGIFGGALTGYLFSITIIAIIGAIVESLPIHDVDNITVTVTAVILGYFLF